MSVGLGLVSVLFFQFSVLVWFSGLA